GSSAPSPPLSCWLAAADDGGDVHPPPGGQLREGPAKERPLSIEPRPQSADLGRAITREPFVRLGINEVSTAPRAPIARSGVILRAPIRRSVPRRLLV